MTALDASAGTPLEEPLTEALADAVRRGDGAAVRALADGYGAGLPAP